MPGRITNLKLANVAITIFVSMFFVLSSTAAAQQKQVVRAEDETAIKKIVVTLENGWNAGNGKAFAAPFAEDADYVIVNGIRIKGRTAIAEGHQGIFDTIYENSRLALAVESLRFLREDVAVVHVRSNLKLKDEAMREGHARSTWVMTRDKGAWSIAAFHNTPIASEQK